MTRVNSLITCFAPCLRFGRPGPNRRIRRARETLIRVRPISITESGSRGAFDSGSPPSFEAVCRPEIAGLGALAVPEDLDVLAGNSVSSTVMSASEPRPNDGPRPGEGMKRAVDLDDGSPHDRARDARRVDGDDALGELVIGQQRHGDAAGKRVPLRGGVLLDLQDEFVDEGRTDGPRGSRGRRGSTATVNLLGTRMRSRATTTALVSSSRRSALVTSTGWRPLRKVLAKAPLTARSRPRSKLSRRPKNLPVAADA